jgi:hypothetical protein
MLETTQVQLLVALERIAVAVEAMALEGLAEQVKMGDDPFYDEWRDAICQVAINRQAAQRAKS